MIHVDQLGAFGGVLFREHSADGHFGFLRVAGIAKNVRVRKLFGFDLNVQGAHRIQAKFSDVELLHEIEHFKRANALQIRRQLVDGPTAVRRGDGLDPFAGKIGKILGGERAAVARGKRQKTLRDFSAIESVAATLRNLAQRPGKVGVAEDFSHFRRTIGNQESFGGGLIVAKHVGFPREVKRDPFGNWETVLGNLNRRGQEFVEFLFSESIEHLLPSIDRAGNGGGFDAVPWHRAQTFFMKALDRLRGGSPAAGVQAVILSTVGVVDDGE